MTEWWPLIAAFWAAFLLDCARVFPSRWCRVLITGAWGRSPRLRGKKFRALARGQCARAVFAPPLPMAWQAYADELPFAFSPEGICNVTTGSGGRETREPRVARSWKWEDIRGVEKKGGRLLVNGRDFCEVTAYAGARELWALAKHCAALGPDGREQHLGQTLRGWFEPARLRRALARVNGRTGTLAFLASANALVALVVSLYFLAGVPGAAGDHWVKHIAQRVLPALGVYAAGVHLAALVAGWLAHRKLMPGRAHGAHRANLLMSAVFLPPQVFRLRAQIAAAALPAQHPLAWFAAVAGDGEFRERAARVLRDLRWPLAPVCNPDPQITSRIASWMRVRVEREAGRMLALRGVTAGELLAAPRPDGAESLGYCPRCRDQFTKPRGFCPCGTPLARIFHEKMGGFPVAGREIPNHEIPNPK